MCAVRLRRSSTRRLALGDHDVLRARDRRRRQRRRVARDVRAGASWRGPRRRSTAVRSPDDHATSRASRSRPTSRARPSSARSTSARSPPAPRRTRSAASPTATTRSSCARAARTASRTTRRPSGTGRVDAAAPQTTIADRPADVRPDQRRDVHVRLERGRRDLRVRARRRRVRGVRGAAPARGPDRPACTRCAVRAIDGAGNIDATPATRTWTYDVIAPQTTIDSASGRRQPRARPRASRFTSSEAGSTFECSLDGARVRRLHVAEQYTGLAVGAHKFRVRATDPAGNRDATPADPRVVGRHHAAGHDHHRQARRPRPRARRRRSTSPPASRT